MKTIDCRGMVCPKPVILAKKEIEAIDSGDITAIVDNDIAKQNMLKLAQSMTCVAKVEEKDGLFYVTITKNAGCSVMDLGNKNLVIFVGNDKLGLGDDKLGTALMKSYMFALSESNILPHTMLFVNGGVKLTTNESEVLESLNKLQEKGVEIMSCGTCLDFYNLKEKLMVGSITNMYSIVEKMNNALNTIKL